MKTHFSSALEHLKNMLTILANKVEHSVHMAIEATSNGSHEAAINVIERDSEIDALEIQIEEECLKILALYQPVASDLRHIVTILKVNNEMERIGDIATNIAERVDNLSLFQHKEIEKIDFSDMVHKVCKMFNQSLDALAYLDIIAAGEVIKADDNVDKIHRENYKKAEDAIIKQPNDVQYYMSCLTISRSLERIADIATNIAEDVIYLASGQIVRHRYDGEYYGK